MQIVGCCLTGDGKRPDLGLHHQYQLCSAESEDAGALPYYRNILSRDQKSAPGPGLRPASDPGLVVTNPR